MEFTKFALDLLTNPTDETVRLLNLQVRFNDLTNIQDIQTRHKLVMHEWYKAFYQWSQTNLPMQYWDENNCRSAGQMVIDLSYQLRSGLQKKFVSIYRTPSLGINMEYESGGCYMVGWTGDTDLNFALSDLLGFDCSQWKAKIQELEAEYQDNAVKARQILIEENQNYAK